MHYLKTDSCSKQGRVCKLCLAGHFVSVLSFPAFHIRGSVDMHGYLLGGQRLSMEEVYTTANQEFYKEVGVKLQLKYLWDPGSRGYENATHSMLTFNFVKLK